MPLPRQKPKRTFWGRPLAPPASQNPLQPRLGCGGRAQPRFRSSAALRAYLSPFAQDLPRPRLYAPEQRVLDHAQHGVAAALRGHLRTQGSKGGWGKRAWWAGGNPDSALRRGARRPTRRDGAGRGKGPAPHQPRLLYGVCRLGLGHRFCLWDLGSSDGELSTSQPRLSPTRIHPGFSSQVPGHQTSKPLDSSGAFSALHPKALHPAYS